MKNKDIAYDAALRCPSVKEASLTLSFTWGKMLSVN